MREMLICFLIQVASLVALPSVQSAPPWHPNRQGKLIKWRAKPCLNVAEWLCCVCSRSSKNRRKAERKKHSLREGSAYEDVALLEALGETVGTVDKIQGWSSSLYMMCTVGVYCTWCGSPEEIRSLLGMLVQYGFTSEASEVQTSFSQLLATVRSKLPSIWQPPTLHPITSTQVYSSTPSSLPLDKLPLN